MKNLRGTVERRSGGHGLAGLLLLLAVLLIGAGTAPHWLPAVVSENVPPDGGPVADAHDHAGEIAPGIADIPAADDGGAGPAAPADLERVADDYHAALQRGDVLTALRHANAYVAAAPNDGYGYALRGYVHWLRSRCDAAVEDLGRAINLSPRYGYAYWARASCRFALGELHGAAYDASAAFSLAANQAERTEALLLKGWIAYAEGRFVDARIAFSQALDLAPDSPALQLASWLAGARGMGERGWPRDIRDAGPESDGQWLDRLALAVLSGQRPVSDLEVAAAEDRRALFYLGQLALLDGRGQDAADLLRRYLATGFSTAVEAAVARRQLKDLP